MNTTISPEQIKHSSDGATPRQYEVGLMGDRDTLMFAASRMERDDRAGTTFLDADGRVVVFVAPGHLRYIRINDLPSKSAAA